MEAVELLELDLDLFLGDQSMAHCVQLWATRRELGYLRKTARGASSPAKPALHIPELEIVSSSPFHSYTWRAAVEGLLQLCEAWARAVRIAPPQQGWQVFELGDQLTHCR